MRRVRLRVRRVSLIPLALSGPLTRCSTNERCISRQSSWRCQERRLPHFYCHSLTLGSPRSERPEEAEEVLPFIRCKVVSGVIGINVVAVEIQDDARRFSTMPVNGGDQV